MKYLRKFLVCVFVFDTLLFCYVVVSTYRQRRKNNTNLHIVEEELYSSESIANGDNIEMSEQKTIDSDSAVFLKESSSTDEQNSNKMDVSQSEDSLSDEYSTILYKKDNSTLLDGKLNYEFSREGSTNTDVRTIPTIKTVFNLNTGTPPHALYFQENSDDMNSPMFIEGTEAEESNRIEELKRKECEFYHEIIRKAGQNRIKRIETELKAQKERIDSIEAQNALIEQNRVEEEARKEETNYTKISANMISGQISKYAYSQNIVEKAKIHKKVLELEKLIKEEAANLEKQEKTNLLLTNAQLQEEIIKIVECTDCSELEQIITESRLKSENYKISIMHALEEIKKLVEGVTNKSMLLEKIKAKKELLIKQKEKYVKLICNLNKKKNKTIALTKKALNEKCRIKYKLNNAHAQIRRLTEQLHIMERKIEELTSSSVDADKNSTEEIRICRDEIDRLHKSINSQKQEIKIYNEKIDEMERSIKNQALNEQSIKKEVSYKNDMLEKYEKEMKDLENIQKEERKYIFSLYAQLKAYEAQIKGENFNAENLGDKESEKSMSTEEEALEDRSIEIDKPIKTPRVSIEMMIDYIKSAYGKMEKRIEDLNMERDEISTKYKKLQGEYISMEDILIKTGDNEGLFVEKLKEKEDQKKELQIELTSKIQNIKDMQTKLDDLRTAVQNAEIKHANLSHQHNIQKNEKQELEENLEQAKEKIEKLTTDLNMSMKDNEEKEKELKLQIFDLQRNIDANIKDNNLKKQMIDELEAKTKNLEDMLEKSNQEITTKNEEIQEYSYKKMKLSESISNKDTDLNLLKTEIDNLKAEIDSKKEEYDRVSAEKSDMLIKNEDLKKELQKAEEGIENIQKDLDACLNEKNNLQHELSEEKNKIDELKSQLDNKDTDINSLQQQINKLNGIIEQKTEEIQAQLTSIKTENGVQEALQTQLNEAIAREGLINEELKLYIQKENELKNDVSEKAKQVQSLEKTINILKKDMENQMKENSNDKACYAEIHKEYTNSIETIDTLKKEIVSINTTINDYKTRFSKLKDEQAIQKKTIQDLNSELKDAKIQIQKKIEENHALSEEKETKVTNYMKELKDYMEIAESKENQLMEKINCYEKKVIDLNAEIKTRNDKIKSLTESLSTHKDELKKKTEESQSNLSEIDELTEEYSKSKAQLDNENKKLKDANESLKKLEDEKIRLLDELTAKNKKIDEMSIEIKDLNELASHRDSEINTLNTSVSSNHAMCDNLNQKIKQMEEDAQKTSSQLQENKERIDALTMKIADKENTIHELKEEIAKMQTIIDKKNITNQKNVLEIADLKTEISNLKQDLMKEKDRANDAAAKLNTCNANKVKLQEEIDSMSDIISNKTSKSTDLVKQIHELEKNKKDLELNLKTAEETIKETGKKLEANKNTIENLESSINDFKTTIGNKSNEYDAKQLEINDLNEKHKQLIEELSKYKKQIDSSNVDTKNYEEKTEQLEKALKETNIALKELETSKETIEKNLKDLNDEYDKVYEEHKKLNENYMHLTEELNDSKKVLEQKEEELQSVKEEWLKSETDLKETIQTMQNSVASGTTQNDKMRDHILKLTADLKDTKNVLESAQNSLKATNDKLTQLGEEKDQLEKELNQARSDINAEKEEFNELFKAHESLEIDYSNLEKGYNILKDTLDQRQLEKDNLNKLKKEIDNERSKPKLIDALNSIESIDIANENEASKIFLNAENDKVRRFREMPAAKKMKIVYDEILEIRNSLVVEEKHNFVWHHFLLFDTEIMPKIDSNEINIGPVSMDPKNWIVHLIRHNMMYKEQAAKMSYCYFKEYNPTSISNMYNRLSKPYQDGTNKKPHAIVLENMVRYCTTLHKFLDMTSKFVFLETNTLSKLADEQYKSLLNAKNLNRMGTKHTWFSEMQKNFKDTNNVLQDLYNDWIKIKKNREQIGRERANSGESPYAVTSGSNEEPILDRYLSLDEDVSSLDVFVTYKTPRFKDLKINFPKTEVIGKTLNFTRTSDIQDGSGRRDLLDQVIREYSQHLNKSKSASPGDSENPRPSNNVDLMYAVFSARPDIKTASSPLFFLDRHKLIGIVAAILNRLEDCLADFKALTQDIEIYNSILEKDLALIQTVRVSMAIHSAAALLQYNILSFQRSKDHFIYSFVYKNLFATNNNTTKMVGDSDKNEKEAFKSEMAKIINGNGKDLNKTNRQIESRHDPKYIESKIAVMPFGKSLNSEYPEFVWDLIKEHAVVDYYLNYSKDYIKECALKKI
ncbi:hypothetical protein NEIRO03_0285 [Nematocida sp. AWRm78]|nr:hypothetical protein NEIRO02_0286 [Nematocida sp. AWRm79]KAI5182621.1 hypothetical protein NEIRO03_0285 [Nematocida sp. AWRm78]